MKTSYQKGNQFEIEVKKTLESAGWEVFRQHRKALFIKGQITMVGADIFGCDLVAKKLDQKTRWIQVSTLSNSTAKQKQVISHIINLMWEDYEIWARVPNKKEFIVYKLKVNPEFKSTPYYFWDKLMAVKAVTK